MEPKAAAKVYLKSGGTTGSIHDYFDDIAIAKWVNRTFGYNVTAVELRSEDPPFSDYDLDMHLAYDEIFGDERIIREARKHRKRFEKRGAYFCIFYEIGSSEAGWQSDDERQTEKDEQMARLYEMGALEETP